MYVALFDHDNEVYPVFAGCTGGDDHLLQLVVLVVFKVLGFYFGTAGHGGEYIVQHAAQFGGGDVGTVFGHSYVGGFFTFGRCPARDGDLLGQTVFEHDTLEVVDCVLGVEADVHLTVPVKD